MRPLQLDLFPASPVQFGPHIADRLRVGMTIDPVRGCWNSPRSTNRPDGYPYIRIGGRYWKVHRVAFVLWRGPILPRRLVLHSCDNPACFNPDHLSVGTPFDNAADASSKGRISQKLSRPQVTEILSSPLTQRALAERFGVAPSTIGHHRRRHVGRKPPLL